jgi:DNA primase
VRFTQDKIDEVRSASDILDVIGQFVKLKKRGKNYVGLCPFHQEKTPSFNVSPEKQMYHCFGCGVGGNVFTFVMEYEKVSFAEAVRSLAEKAGITLPMQTEEAEAELSEQEQLYEVCKMAGRFYYDCLTQTQEGKLALEYFHHRGFTDETIRTFGLGYSPNSWDALINYAKEKSISIDFLQKAGLVRKRDDGSWYDYFRGRAMFPIFSTTGRVVGFGARKLREDDPLGKYINSPETVIYNKSRILYGIYQSKDAIRENDSAILVEGYADLISVFQAGVNNIVASSGTALTQEQIQLIGRYTKNTTIVYDADSAGSKAALRGVDLVLENDLDVKVAQLPAGEDPDSFVKKNGGETFAKLISQAVSFVDFIARAYEEQGQFDSPEGKTKAVRAIVQTIAKMRDELKRNFYIQQVAQQYKLYESTLHRELEKILGEQRRWSRSESFAPREIFPSKLSIELAQESTESVPTAERDLLHAMLEGGTGLVKFVFEHLKLENFTHPDVRSLASTLLEKMEEGVEIDPASFLDEVEGESQRRLVAGVLMSKYQLSKGWDESKVNIEQGDVYKVAADAIKVFRRRALEKLVEENQRLLKEASRSGKDVVSYLEKHQKFLQEMKEVDNLTLIPQKSSA